MEHGPDTEKVLKRYAEASAKERPVLWLVDLNVTSLPPFPQNLVEIHIFNLPIKEIPWKLPKTLLKLEIYKTNVESLPTFPEKIEWLSVRKSPLKRIPDLPWSLKYLNVNETELIYLPKFPSSLHNIACSKTPLIIPKSKILRKGKHFHRAWEFWEKRVWYKYRKTPEQVFRFMIDGPEKLKEIKH